MTQPSPHRNGRDLQAFETALDQLGGVDYLVRLGRANPAAFALLLASILPLDVQVTSAVTVSGQ